MVKDLPKAPPPKTTTAGIKVSTYGFGGGGEGVGEREGDANIQTTAPPYQCTCILEGLRTREISYYTEAEWWWKSSESLHYSDLGILVNNDIIVDH